MGEDGGNKSLYNRQCVETIQEEPKLKLCTDFNMVKIESSTANNNVIFAL